MISKPVICQNPSCTTLLKATTDTFINNNSCGIIIGKPIIAIKDACCFAFAAIAAKKVKTKLNPKLPKKEIKTNLYK